MKLVICVQLAYVSVCLTREMSVVREWTSLDVHLASGDEQESRRSITPSDVKSWFMYKDKAFVALSDQPYSLAYFDLTDKSTSPLLQPYSSNENQQKIYKPFQVRVDRCNRLWVLSENNHHTKKDMKVFDLKTHSILRTSMTIPSLADSLDMTVDDLDCGNEYVYISDHDAFWTYSWAEGSLTRHNTDRIGPMILTPNSTVYYNVAGEPIMYYMPTTHLKDNKTIDIKKLGRSRNLNVNLASSALDVKSDVLYYFNNDNRTVIHAVPCWTSERCSSNCQDVSIDPSHELRYITVDENGDLRAITSRSSFKDGEINLRLLSAPVNSTCVQSNAEDTTNTSAGDSTGEDSSAKETNTTNINESTTAPSSATDGRTICQILPLLIFLITILTKV